MTPASAVAANFEPECRAAIDSLRAALVDLYASVGADPAGPQDVARRFGINKTLAWNVCKVITSRDALACIPNLPGSSAFQSLFSAMEADGADAGLLGRARDAVQAVSATVARHAGDRATLDLIVDGISPERDDYLEHSRRLAFRGNSGLLGVQAKLRLMTVFLTPSSTHSGRLDIAMSRGYVGLRRLRTDVRWPVFQLRSWGNEPSVAEDSAWQPIDPQPAESRAPLLRDFSSVGPTDLVVERTRHGTNHLLAPGPIGNVGAVDCFLADAARGAAPRHRTGADTTGEFGVTISAPTERLVFDLYAHEELDFVLQAEPRAFMGIFMDPSEEPVPEGGLPLPVPKAVSPLPGSPPACAIAAFPRYGKLIQHVAAQMEWDLRSFRAVRYEVSFPPLGSTILLRFQLPPADPR